MRGALALCLACWPLGAAATTSMDAAASPRADAYFEYCLSRQALMRHDFGAALEYMKSAAASDPNSAELALEAAQLHLDLNDPENAATAARRALELSPDWPPAQQVLANALLAQAMRRGAAQEASGEAEKAYKDLLAKSPDDASAWINLARLQLSSGRMDEGIASLKRHLDLEPGSEEGGVLAARALLEVKRPADAVALLKRSVEQAPRSPGLRLALAEVQEAAGDPKGALETLASLRAFPTMAPRAALAMARLQQRLGKPAEAVRLLEEGATAMEANPAEYSEAERAEAQLRWARGLIDAGRPEEAAARASKAGPQRPGDVRFALVEAEALLTLGKDEQAEQLLSGRLADMKDMDRRAGLVSDVYLAVGSRCERAGDISCAKSRLQRSIDALPTNDEALNYLGYMLAERGERLEEAEEMIRKALVGEPGNGAYLDSLGWVQFRKGDYAAAEESLRAAAAAMPEEPAVHEHLGDVYSATGRRDEALKSWQEAIDRNAPNADAVRARMKLPPVIRAWVKGRLSTGERKSRFEGAIVAMAPDRLRVDLSGPVGGTRASVAVRQGRMRVLLPAQKEYIETEASPGAWEALLGVGVDTAALIDLIRQAEAGAPELPVRAGDGRVQTLTVTRQGDKLTLTAPGAPDGSFQQLDLHLREVEHPAPASINAAAFELEIPQGWTKLDLKKGSAAPVLVDPAP